MIEFEKIQEDVKNALSKKRYIHSLGVVERAEEFAALFNVDLEKARYAAILHDIAKEIPKEEAFLLLKKYNVELDEVEKVNFNLVHGKLGAAIAKYEYNMPDDIVSAIKYHTTGKANMTTLEKIIYLADATEKNRTYLGKHNDLTLEEVVELIKKDLDEGLLYVLKWSLNSVLRHDLLIQFDSVEAYNFYWHEKV